MPIRPENRNRYPPSWREISQSIRFERAKGRCECEGECGEAHIYERCDAEHGREHPVTRATVVLTVAHLDHTPENNEPTNLRAMCQRCHNRYDAPMRRAGIRARRHDAQAVGDLFDGREHREFPR